jgi:hypothetical protein
MMNMLDQIYNKYPKTLIIDQNLSGLKAVILALPIPANVNNSLFSSGTMFLLFRISYKLDIIFR